MELAAANSNNRRGKAALFLIFCFCAGVFPHWIDSTKNLIPAITVAFLLGGYGLRVVLRDRDQLAENFSILIPSLTDNPKLPSIDILVAARDEENVVERLIKMLDSINYPKEKISCWVIDDGSEDRTSDLVKDLISKLPNFHLLQRSRSAGGGKSGALNYALSYVKGDWLLILDADAQLQKDVVLRLILLAINSNEFL